MGLLFGPAFFAAGLALANFDRVSLGVKLGEVSLGGRRAATAQAPLAQKINNFYDQLIIISFGETRWTASPQELGITIDLDRSLAQALAFGHGKNLAAAVAEQFQALFFGKKIELEYSIDTQQFNQTLQSFSSIETPAANASLTYRAAADEIIILPPQTGHSINRGRLLQDIKNSFDNPPSSIELTLIESQPIVTTEDLSMLQQLAQAIFDQAPFWLTSPEASWPIDKIKLADWLLILPPKDSLSQTQISFDQAKIETWLKEISLAINQEPINAQLAWENDQLKFAVLARAGQSLNLEESFQAIKQGLLNSQKKIELAIDSVEPLVNNQNTQELGLIASLAQGESNFAGSPKNRLANIKIGSTKLSGWLIKPKEEFSFSQAIGEIDEANGWLPELVIKNNQTLPEFGGGICQISTTLFRAAVKAGLKIIERYPHAYPVKYYNPPGFDATVYPPKPDLKFLNDTTGYLLLQSKIVGTRLIFEIFGQPDGRETKIIGPTILVKNPDGSMKTILTQEIWRAGKLSETNVFRSNYKSPDLYPLASPSPSPNPSNSPTP